MCFRFSRSINLQCQWGHCRLKSHAFHLSMSCDAFRIFVWLAVYAPCLSERVSETVSTWVQGGSCEEVTLHPATLQHLQGLVGLANSTGDLLCCCRCALRHLLCQSRWRQWPSLTSQSQHHGQWHSSGDALHTWYDIFICDFKKKMVSLYVCSHVILYFFDLAEKMYFQ